MKYTAALIAIGMTVVSAFAPVTQTRMGTAINGQYSDPSVSSTIKFNAKAGEWTRIYFFEVAMAIYNLWITCTCNGPLCAVITLPLVNGCI